MTSKDDSTDVQLDIRKYDGHKEGPWKIYYDKWNKTGWYIDSIARYDVGEGDVVCQLYGTAQNKDPTAKLIADAPLLLEEVKRLRTEIAVLKNQYQSCQKSLMDQTNWSVRLVEAIDGGKMSEIKRVRNS